jgi:tripeptide aminopeptidase
MKQVMERFLHYVRMDTQSDEESKSCPSTRGQRDLAGILYHEMTEAGFEDVTLDRNGYLMGTIPSNSEKEIPVIGFIAHLDTSPDMISSGVNPLIHENYDGGDLILNHKEKIILSPSEFPELLSYRGQTLITTSGTTLLGADDKAGIAEIMTAMEFLLKNPEKKHGKIRIAFTPDEEIGRGADKFNVKEFGAAFAYTVDGGELGELEFETFNAAMATIRIRGRNVHPGTAKNKMINSVHIAAELYDMLPVSARPEYTEQYEGFFHLFEFKGKVENTLIRILIRDHDRRLFDEKKKLLNDAAGFLNRKYGNERISVEIKDQYLNMREMIEPVYHIVEYAEKAMIRSGVKPVIVPVRGGTDGSRLSYMGLPCPNIFTGGHNFHGKYEYIPVESMEKACRVIVEITGIVAGLSDR